jgi:uncharacterized protein
MQATPFCNLACTYCYLPDKGLRKKMKPDVIKHAVEQVLKLDIVGSELSVVWHAGEPLAAGIPFYREAHRLISQTLGPEISLRHCIQTNGTLINDDWCQLFKDIGMSVGVSIDGPPELNDKFRLTKANKGSTCSVEKGIECLRANNVTFHTISVVTKDALAMPKRIFDYLRNLGADTIAFNIEEVEGVHTESSMIAISEADYRQFLSEIYKLSIASGEVNYVREFRSTHQAIMSSVIPNRPVLSMENNPLSIVNVDINGNMSTYSPELLGMVHPEYGDFLIGNVLTDDIRHKLQEPKFRKMARAIAEGVDKCQQTCPYFHFCGGGAPSNKLFENGTFESTETMHCRMTRKLVVDVTMDQAASLMALKLAASGMEEPVSEMSISAVSR